MAHAVTISVNKTLLAGREEEKNTLNGFLSEKKNKLLSGQTVRKRLSLLPVPAIEMGHENIAACITTDDGWRFIDKNPSIQLCLAMNSDISDKADASLNELFYSIFPGDHNTTGNKRSDTITLERLTRSGFEESSLLWEKKNPMQGGYHEQPGGLVSLSTS
jgi:hypothetical protein